MVAGAVAAGAAASGGGDVFGVGRAVQGITGIASTAIDEINQILHCFDTTIIDIPVDSAINILYRWWTGDDEAVLMDKPVNIRLSILRILGIIAVALVINDLVRFQQNNGRLPSLSEWMTSGVKDFMTMFVPVGAVSSTAAVRTYNERRESGTPTFRITGLPTGKDLQEAFNEDPAGLLDRLGIKI